MSWPSFSDNSASRCHFLAFSNPNEKRKVSLAFRENQRFFAAEAAPFTATSLACAVIPQRLDLVANLSGLFVELIHVAHQACPVVDVATGGASPSLITDSPGFHWLIAHRRRFEHLDAVSSSNM